MKVRVKVRVSYSWPGIEDDVAIVEVDDPADLDEIAVETANEIIWNRVSIDYEVLEDDD